jgi:dipeptidyl-peptidase-4
VSFIRAQNLYVLDLRTGQERALTSDGGGTLKNGMAEFIAQEEMGRNTGYWWSPDEERIAYAHVDEAPIPEHRRFEVEAGELSVYTQRYPEAGARNALLELRSVELAGGAVTPLDLGPESDIYLARVDWFPDSRHIAVQRQSRDQRRLDLLKIDASSGQGRTLLTETSSTWVDLNDELTFLRRSKRFIWGSMRSGYQHLYLYDFDGKLIRPLTAGNWMVVADGGGRALLDVDEVRERVYFMANEASTLERHLYAAPLGRQFPPTRITRETGWHTVTVSPDHTFFLDVYSNPERPPRVQLRYIDGSVMKTLMDNPLDNSHPYAPYRDSHVPMEFGTLRAADGQTMNYQILKPTHFDPARKYPVIVDVYGGPEYRTFAVHGAPSSSARCWRRTATSSSRSTIAAAGSVVSRSSPCCTSAWARSRWPTRSRVSGSCDRCRSWMRSGSACSVGATADTWRSCAFSPHLITSRQECQVRQSPNSGCTTPTTRSATWACPNRMWPATRRVMY